MKIGIETNVATAIALGTTAGGGPNLGLMGWELTPTNIGLAPYGLVGASLPTYTTNPVPANTTITEKRIVWSNGALDLNAGGITIQRCLLQPNPGGTSSDRIVESFTPPNPNRIIDSELDGSLIGQEEVSKACGLRGIWSEITRCYIHDVGSGICLVDYTDTFTYDVTYTNNLIRLLRAFGDPVTTGSHNEAATTRCFRVDLNPSRRMTWDANWIETFSTGGIGGPGANDSGGLFIQTIGCAIGNLYVTNNYMTDPGNYDMYADGAGYTASSQFQLVNNRFGPWGYGACAISGFTWDVQSGNSVYDGGNPPDYNGTPTTC